MDYYEDNDFFTDEEIMDQALEFPVDRILNTTDNNEYAVNLRDETVWEEDIVDTEIPFSDSIPGVVHETGWGERPIYSENGYETEDLL